MRLPSVTVDERNVPTIATWLTVLVILVIAAALRFILIDRIPPGYTFDEAAAGVLASEVYRGIERPIFFQEFLGQEPLFIYASAGMMALLGGNQDILPLHLTSIWFGLSTVLLTYLVARELFGTRVGIIASATIAGSFWQVMMGRNAYRSITQTCLEALSLYLLAVAWRRRAWLWFVLCGAAMGATLYTYLAARAFPAVFIGFGVWLLLNHGRPTRATALQVTALAAVALLVVTPQAAFFLSNPGMSTMRMGQVLIFRTAVNHGHPWQLLGENAAKLLASFTFKGEEFWRYSLPGRPMFVGAVAVGFYVGLVLLARGLWRRDDRLALVAIALGVMFFPSLLSWDAGTYTLRSMGLVPMIYLVPALGLDWLWRKLARVNRWGPPVATVVVSLILLVDGAWTARDYFVTWAPSFGASWEGGADSVAQARFLSANARPATEDVFVANVLYHNPVLSQLAGAQYPDVRWTEGPQDVVFAPESHRPALYVLAFAGLPAELDALFPRSTLVGEQLFPAGVDGGAPPPLFVAYRLTADQTQAQVASLTNDSRLRPVAGEIGHALVPVGARFGGAVRAGEMATATLIWRVRQPLPPSDYQMVVQLLDQRWNLVGTVEGLGLPPTEWRPGDIVVSHVDISVPPTTAAGLYKVQLALYDTHTGQRVPVYGGPPGIQALILGDVRVIATAPARPPGILLGARLGTDVRLVGVDPPHFSDPSHLAVALDWAAERPLTQDYTVFVQLLGSDGKLVAQSDSGPANGDLPTSSWLPGEVVRDEHILTLKPGLSGGTYHLIAGLYLLSTGQRLPVVGGGDFVDLESLTLPN